MDRLISLEPSNVVPIRIEPGFQCRGELTLRNVMYTMPVAFRLQPLIKDRYFVKPQSGIISPLSTLTLEIIYNLPTGSLLPNTFPHSDDSFLLHSAVVPGAAIRESASSFDVPADWFTTKKKQVFIDSGIKIMFVGSAVLAQLVADGSMEMIREVLEKSDSAWKAADSMDMHGQTLLHLAITMGRADLVQLLLEFDPDVEAKSSTGSTPLEAASASGETLIVELLLAHRARTERSESSSRGPIHLAAAMGHVEVLRLLLLKGAIVDSHTKDGNTALHLAVEGHRRDCARLLLASGARVDIHNADEGDTPLHVAARLGDEQMVKLLLQNRTNKDIRNHDGKTAYAVAAEHGHSRLFDVLRLGDKLCIAARKGDARTIQRLLKNGAAINGRDQNGWNALHRASFKGQIDAARALLHRGIEINAKDEDGYTALHCAVESGHVDVIQLLVKKGIDIEAKTNKGATALQIAQSLNYAGITTILLHGGPTNDSHISFSSANLLSYDDKTMGREVDDGSDMKKKKKKHSRGRKYSNL